MPFVRTLNKKRKSLANGEDSEITVSPKGNTPKAPGKANATPGKVNKPFNKPNNVKTPKPAGNGNPTISPKPGKIQQQTPGRKNKRGNETQTGATIPKKMKKFGGTSELQLKDENKQAQSDTQKNQANEIQPKKENKGDVEKPKKRRQFLKLKTKVNNGDKSAVKDLETKIKEFQARKELTRTGKRKLKFLQRMLRNLTGEAPKNPPVSGVKKRKGKKLPIIKKYQTKEGGKTNAKSPQKNQNKSKQTIGEDGDDSDESDYEVEAEIKPDKIIKTEETAESDDDDDDDDDEEEEESDDELEGEESEGSDEEGEEESEEDDSKPVANQKGGKKKTQERKNEVKAKNFKFQAMRKQGQLAGSVKQNQKRSVRRAKKNAGAVNGSD